MRITLVGAGAVGARAARQLVATGPDVHVLVSDTDLERAASVVSSLGREQSELGRELHGVDAAILALPGGEHAAVARELVDNGVPVVSVADDVDDVRALLALDEPARARGVAVVAGAGFSPGLTCLLAAHAA